MEFIQDYLPQIFIILGLVLVLMEIILGVETGLDLVLIGSILVISGFAGLLTGSLVLMFILAIGLSIFYIAFGRRLIRNRMMIVTTEKTNIDRLIGVTGTVVGEISPTQAGMIRIDDERWRATAEEVLYEHDVVQVDSIEGVTLRVSKLAKLKG